MKAGCDKSQHPWCHYHLWVYRLHVKGHTIYGVTTTCFTVGVWAAREMSHYLWCHYHLFLQWVYGLNVKGDNIHVTLSLVCYSDYIIMLDVKGGNIHIAIITCFRMGVCAECDNMQNYCHYHLFDNGHLC